MEKKKGEKDGIETEEKYLFGWFSCTPRSLQCCSTIGWFLAFITIANTFQSMTINGLVGVVLSSLEKRFNLPSTQSAWIHNSYDVATVPMLLIVSYVGAQSHRPRWTAIGLAFMAVGSIIFISPHFITPVYEPVGPGQDSGLCRNRTGEDVCPDDEQQGGSLSGYLAVFIIGRVFHGLGATPLYTLAATYLDDCVTKEKFSFYVAIFYSAGVLGPAFGYIVGGFMLSVYTDFISVDKDKIGIDSGDPRWVGAWWMGFLIAAVFLALMAIPISCYPRDLPGAALIRSQKTSEANAAKSKNLEDETNYLQEAKITLKELPHLLKGLLTNWTYVFLTIYISLDAVLINGFTGFGPKFLEEQYSTAASFAGMLFGIVTIPGGAGGTIFGGFLIEKLKISCAGIIKIEIFLALGVAIASLSFLLYCNPAPFVGIDSEYPNLLSGMNASCYSDCMCDSVAFSPICSVATNSRYYSPCHAGCTNVTENGFKEYFNCSCIPMVNITTAAATSQTCASPGCAILPLFMVIFFIAMFMIFMCEGMNVSATVRCVPNSHKSLAIGVQWICLRLLGSIPGPIIFGAVFDSACVQRVVESCTGKLGTCIYYDNQKLSYVMFGLCASVKFISMICVILALKFYKAPQEKDIVLKVTDSEIDIAKDNPMPMQAYDNEVTLPETELTPSVIDDSYVSDFMGRSNTTAETSLSNGFTNKAFAIQEQTHL